MARTVNINPIILMTTACTIVFFVYLGTRKNLEKATWVKQNSSECREVSKNTDAKMGFLRVPIFPIAGSQICFVILL